MAEDDIEFGRSLLGPDAEPLRAAIIASVNEARPLARLCVDDVLTPDTALTAAMNKSECLFLLIDMHRVFLFRQSPECGGPSVADVLQYIQDDHPFDPPSALDTFLQDGGCLFAHEPEMLKILPYYWFHLPPETVVAFDLVIGEIRVATPLRHPAVLTETERKGDSGPANRNISDLDGLTSWDIGLIRSERISTTSAYYPSAVLRIVCNRRAYEDCAGGDSSHPSISRFVARCEAVERFHLLFPDPVNKLFYGSFSQIQSDAIHPIDLLFCRSSKTPSAALSRIRMYWTSADHYLSGDRRWVPAQDIWFNTNRLPGENLLVKCTTSGCAVSTSVEDAALRSTLELIERDAYLTMWYLRRRPSQIAPEAIETADFMLLWNRVTYALPGYRFYFLDIRSELAIPAVAAIAVRMKGNGPKTFHATAAGIDLNVTMFKVLQDLGRGVQPHSDESKCSRAAELVRNPDLVTSIDDHVTLFSSDDMLSAQDFLKLDAAPTVSPRDIQSECDSIFGGADTSAEQLRRLGIHLEKSGLPLYTRDLSYPWVSNRGIHCVRSVVPGLFPMWFGFGNRRFRVTDRLKALARRIGVPPPIADENVNLVPHPFG